MKSASIHANRQETYSFVGDFRYSRTNIYFEVRPLVMKITRYTSKAGRVNITGDGGRKLAKGFRVYLTPPLQIAARNSTGKKTIFRVFVRFFIFFPSRSVVKKQPPSCFSHAECHTNSLSVIRTSPHRYTDFDLSISDGLHRRSPNGGPRINCIRLAD